MFKKWLRRLVFAFFLPFLFLTSTDISLFQGQGGFIELRHSKHADPAIRREQLIRAGGALPVTSSVSTIAQYILATRSTASPMWNFCDKLTAKMREKVFVSE